MSMRAAMLCRAVLWGGVAAVAAASSAAAQAPPGMPEAGEIAACLCLGQAVAALSADLAAQQGSYAAVRDELTRLDSQLERERAGMDVNNPQSVARFRQLLEQRDAAFRRSTSLATGDLNRATERYNYRVNEYNARCANRPRDPSLLGRVQATLSCPPPS
jgi:hypothetical protein